MCGGKRVPKDRYGLTQGLETAESFCDQKYVKEKGLQKDRYSLAMGMALMSGIRAQVKRMKIIWK